MLTIDNLTTLLGWASLINIGILMLTTVAMILMRRRITELHSRLFQLERSGLPRIYFQYLAQYKIAIMVLNIAPYLALKIMSWSS